MREDLGSVIFLPTLSGIGLFRLRHSKWCILFSYGSNLHFPVTNDCENLSMCLLATFLSSLVKPLFKSFLCWVFVFLIWSFESSLYILDTNPLEDMCFAKRFSSFVAFYFILVTISFLLTMSFQD